MVDKEALLKGFRVEFDRVKKEFGFTSSFVDIEKFFYVEDMVLAKGYVSPRLTRQLVNRMVDMFHSWVGEMYAWLYPQPMDAIHTNESKKLSADERKELLVVIDKIMFFVRKSKRVSFKGLVKEEEAGLIDELVVFAKKDFYPVMLRYHEKFELMWKEEFEKTKEEKDTK